MKYKVSLSDDIDCEYDLLESKRAKYIRIKISATGKISVVIPHTIKNQQHAHDFVVARKNWIIKCLKAIREAPPPPETITPSQLSLHLIDECWQVDYEAASYEGISLSTHRDNKQNKLLLQGQINDKDLVFDVLAQWLKSKAKTFLPEILSQISKEYNLPYNRVTIRGQKTRWGSCSSKKNINLNYKLLFFPENIVRYVLIHELCHTREMNHSKQFWDLVKQFDPDYQQHRSFLKSNSHSVPLGL